MKQRLYPDADQVPGLLMHVHHARFVYNIALEQRSMWVASKHDRPEHPELGVLSTPRINYYAQQKQLAELRGELKWLREGSSSVQQTALRDLDRAFANFFAGRGSYPTFKKRSERQGSFYVRDLTVRRLSGKWGTVMVPKLGPVRFRISREWSTIQSATSARVTLRNGTWHICFTTPPVPKKNPHTGSVVGIDRGVTNTLTDSNGLRVTMPSWTPGEQRRFLALEQRLARQTTAAKKAGRAYEHCRNRNKTLNSLARLRRTLDQRRTDFIEQTTTAYASTHDLVVLEKLNTRGMVKKPTPVPDPHQAGAYLSNGARAKAALNRAIHASRWAEFATRLEHKTNVVYTPAAYTSQECRQCHHTSSKNRQSQAVFICLNCGHTEHADINAAQVIEHRVISHIEDAITTTTRGPRGIALNRNTTGGTSPQGKGNVA